MPRLISLFTAAAAALSSATVAPAAERRPPPSHEAPPWHAPHHEAPAFHPGPGPGPGRGPGPGFWRPPPRVEAGPRFEYRREPGLPLNNPEALRPNFPAARSDVPEPRGGAGPGIYYPAPAAADPTGAMQALVAPAPPRPPVVVRPLPPGGPATTVRPAVDRGRRFVSLHGVRHALVPAAGLGVAVIGDSAWYPDGYVPVEGPACTGPTADGCRLQWRMVEVEDGDADPQPECVQYCPQPGPPPPGAAALPPPPALPEGGGECQATIYSESNFAGNSAPTGANQPVLTTTGWRNEIASIVVGAGTWDFFAGENFAGEALRLTPGTYPRLAPEWQRRIGSFMCTKGDGPPG